MNSTESSTIRNALGKVGIELTSDKIDELTEIYIQLNVSLRWRS